MVEENVGAWQPPRPIHFGRGVAWLLATVAALLVCVLALGLALLYHLRQQVLAEVSTSTSDTAQIVTAGQVGAIVPADQAALLKSDLFPAFVDIKPEGDLDETEIQLLINQALTQPANLKNWQLCAAELKAAAAFHRGGVEAARAAPTPDVSLLTGKDFGFASATASIYEQAAFQAEQQNIGCAVKDSAKARWLAFTVTVYGQPRQLALSDTRVMQGIGTLEAHLRKGSCASEARQTRALYTKPGVEAVFGQQELADRISAIDALIEFLRQFPETNC